MSVLTSRQHQQPQTAVSVAGQEEMVEPAQVKPVSASPISAAMQVPSEPTEWKAPVVYRGQRKQGMRYLWSHGGVRQPISPLGTGPDIGVGVWSSSYQPDEVTQHNWGFYDALFCAGYPGFNLGLSFKVAELPKQLTGPGTNMRMQSSNVRVTINKAARSMAASGSG